MKADSKNYLVFDKMAQKLQITPWFELVNNEPKVSFVDCIKNGFIVINYKHEPKDITKSMFEMLKSDFSRNNKTLFGNFENVVNMTDAEYYAHQILHYFSTYGLESLGLQAHPYIPAKELWAGKDEVLKDINEDAKITVIRLLDDEDYINELTSYICEMKAPKNDTLFYEYCFDLIPNSITENDIRSYEMKAIFYNKRGIYPKNPIDFLRYVIYLAIGNTLMIKNKAMMNSIKSVWDSKSKEKIVNAFKSYDLTKLASIFYRFKPLFLSFKSVDPKIKPIINKIRKLAPTYHKPLEGLCVQNVFEMSDYFTQDELKLFIKDIDTRDLFKLLNAWANANNEYRIFGIRNGKAYVKEKTQDKDLYNSSMFNTVKSIMDEINDRYAKKFEGKAIIIPSYINYRLPISEKDMVGKYPNGTYLEVGKNSLSLGIAWNNKEDKSGYDYDGRVDIDLYLISATKRFGWNSSRTDGDIIYSGDMTDATNGAAEAFYINNTNDDYIIDTRLYTGNEPVDMNLFISKKKVERSYGKDYIYDPNEDIIPNIPLTIKNEGLNIGLYHDGKVYLYNKSISSGIVPTSHYESFIKGLVEKLEKSVDLKDIFDILKVPVYNSIEDLRKDYDNTQIEDANIIDLDPSIVTEKTLFDLFEK